MRTQVLPSSMATAKSPLMPMERTGRWRPESVWIKTRKARRAAKQGRDFWVRGEGGDGHEAAEAEAGQGVDGLGEGAGGVGGAAELGAFAGDVDLEEDVLGLAEGVGAVVDLLGEVEAVDGVDGVEEADGVLGLVALEVADEMPDAAADLFDLGEGFLDLVFAEAGRGRRAWLPGCISTGWVLLTARSSISARSRPAFRGSGVD